MLHTGSPLANATLPPSDVVRPLDMRRASKSSTPGLTSRASFTSLPSTRLPSPSCPARPRSAPPPLVRIAISPALFSRPDRPVADGEAQMDQLAAVEEQPSGIMPSQGASLPTAIQVNPQPSNQPDIQCEIQPEVQPEIQRHIPHLFDLAQSLRLQKYHERLSHQAQRCLHAFQVTAARTHRLLRASHGVQSTLAECIRSEDKASFVNLFNVFSDACDHLQRTAGTTMPNAGFEPALLQPEVVSFFKDLSPATSSALLDFMTKLRYDGAFIADRIGKLSQRELINLLPDRRLHRSPDSIFGVATRSGSRTSRPMGFVVDAQVDLLTSRGYGSPLEALALVPMALSSEDSTEVDRMTSVWAIVCRKLIVEQKPGYERFIPAILDLWATLLPWPGKDRLEMWILQTLQNGSFLFESNRQTFRSRTEANPDSAAEDIHRAEYFYAQATASLLDLVGDVNGPSLIPPGALKLCHATWKLLQDSPGHQRAFSQFISNRWLFPSFLPDVITLPEAHNMATDYYFSETARHRILREVVARSQKIAFDVAYPWKCAGPVAAEAIRRIGVVFSKLEGRSATTESIQSPQNITDQQTCRASTVSQAFMAVTAADLCGLLRSLYPHQRPLSIVSDLDTPRSGLQSSASSVSGFSLFPSPYPNDTVNAYTNTVQPEMSLVNGYPPHSAHQNIHSDYSAIHEAYQELEEFATSRATDSREHWELLTIPQHSDHVRIMEQSDTRSSASQGLKTEGLKKSGQSPLDTSSNGVSCKRAVQRLLQNKYLDPTDDGPANFANKEDELTHIQDSVIQLFREAITCCEEASDFVGAYDWHSLLQTFELMIAQPTGLMILHEALLEIEDQARHATDRAKASCDDCEIWNRALRKHDSRLAQRLGRSKSGATCLRDKIWYVVDVRSTAAYEQAKSIATALRIMGKPKRSTRTRAAPPLRHWSGPKIPSVNLHLKTEVQILEILSAKSDQGGPNKLSDEQAKATAQWIDSNGVSNICKGEERLHKLFFEIRKCVDAVMANPLNESSTLSGLFSREMSHGQHSTPRRPAPLFSNFYLNYLPGNSLTVQSKFRSLDTISNTSHTLSSMSSKDFADDRSPTLTHKSSLPFWSPTMTEAESPSTATSIGSSMTQSALDMPARKHEASTVAKDTDTFGVLRQRAVGLLWSDLSVNLFSDGSETDRAFWTGLGWELTDRHFSKMQKASSLAGSKASEDVFQPCSRPAVAPFDFETAFSTILRKFTAVSNPFTKLSCLYDIDRLMGPYVAQRRSNGNLGGISLRPESCEDPASLINGATVVGDTASIQGFRQLFAQVSTRPATIFRDLQFISSLVPASILNESPQGKAFQNAVVAILQLKLEARAIMVETADSIIAFHSNNRGHGRGSTAAQRQRDEAMFPTPTRSPPAEEVSRYTMMDAAHLLQITAREGHSVAQRELATLYLTHPELMDRIIAPFARPRDVFREELESKWRRNQDPNRCDPATMCVAHHWMTLSSRGGDPLAKEYLRQREEMDLLGS